VSRTLLRLGSILNVFASQQGPLVRAANLGPTIVTQATRELVRSLSRAGSGELRMRIESSRDQRAPRAIWGLKLWEQRANKRSTNS